MHGVIININLMKIIKFWLMAGFCFCGFVLHCRSELQWNDKQISQAADPLAKSVTATFHFKNVGDKAVTIREVKPGCGCTTAALEKMTYAPGESGDIVAKFNIGNRQGQQNKTIKVTSDADKDPVVVLTMKTMIPQLLAIQPAFVFWKQGEAPEAKMITLTPDVSGLHVVKAQSDNEKVSVQLEEVEGGGATVLPYFLRLRMIC